ncbi:MAG: tryptophan-rich sensory protein [Methanomicrobium sp.]|jgi:tryptophan-rich sensory protein|nr:tryptophan-rich sensory protein [Methanomicrobium sp.]
MEIKQKIKNPAALAASVIGCNLAGAVGSIFTQTGPDSWYAGLIKPWFLPPSIAFPIAWTILYTLMGICLYLIWIEDREDRHVKVALGFFAIQLLLNILWSYLFFGLQNPMYGLIGIIFLWIFIAETIIASYRVSKNAGYLLIPYIAWVSFATLLNAAILLLNPVVF